VPAALLEAVGRALAARRVHILPTGALPPAPRRSRWRRREETHLLTVDVPGGEWQLAFELNRPSTLEDRLVAETLAGIVRRSEPYRPAEQTPRAAAALEVLRALGTHAAQQPETVLRALLRVLRVPAGAVAAAGDEPVAWTVGPGRPVLERAAIEAIGGPDGHIEVRGRTFMCRQLRWDGQIVGGVAVEDAGDSPSRSLGAEGVTSSPIPGLSRMKW
jgi:hypothetical protein